MSPVIQDLSRLVAFPTVSDQPVTEISAFLAERAEAAGFRVERYETSPGKVNVVCARGPAGTDGLLLSGHMDVVPVAGQAWSTDPFSVVERGGRLYGRGTCDMKGFIAATLQACDALRGRELSRELVLAWTHDEEVGCQGSRALVARLRSEPRPLPRACVIGEPTSFRICRLHPGHTTFRVVCSGRPAHSSRPDLGTSAVRIATRALLQLEELEAELRHERAFEAELPSPWPVLNTAIVRGGAAVNIVPDRCEILLGVRQLPGQSADAIEARLRDRLAPLDAAARSAGGAVSLERVQSCPSLLTSETCSHLPLLQAHASDPRPTGAPFATDGGNLSALGVEPLVFGPGSIDVAHRPDEYIEAAELHRAVDVLADLIHQRCAAPPGAAAR